MSAEFYREIVAALRHAGCHYVRSANGSHELWYSPVTRQKFIVCRTKSRITANRIMKQAGLDKRF